MEPRIESELVLTGLQLRHSGGNRDWMAVLSAIRGKLDALSSHPLIANDPQCSAIIADMTAAGHMPDFARRVDELAYRVAWLLRERDGENEELELFLRKPVRGSRKGADNPRPSVIDETDVPMKSPRTRFHL